MGNMGSLRGSKSDDLAWYICELIMEIAVEKEPGRVIHKNLFLINAPDSQRAYEKARRLGKKAEASYLNPQDHQVEHRFEGVSKLDILIDGLPQDGAELAFQEVVGVSDDELAELIPPKEMLWAFRRPAAQPPGVPDYRSKDVLGQIHRVTLEHK